MQVHFERHQDFCPYSGYKVLNNHIHIERGKIDVEKKLQKGYI